MQEIRLVNRAKWLLITEKGMTEEDAHRCIEKLAMNNCITKSAAAQAIIDEKDNKLKNEQHQHYYFYTL